MERTTEERMEAGGESYTPLPVYPLFQPLQPMQEETNESDGHRGKKVKDSKTSNNVTGGPNTPEEKYNAVEEPEFNENPEEKVIMK